MMHTEVRIAWKSLREHNIEINNFKKKRKKKKLLRNEEQKRYEKKR